MKQEASKSDSIEIDVTDTIGRHDSSGQRSNAVHIHMPSKWLRPADVQDLSKNPRLQEMKRLKLEEESQTEVVTDTNCSDVSAPDAGGIKTGRSIGSCSVVMGSSQLTPRLETSGSASDLRGLLRGCGMDGVGVRVSVGMGEIS